MVLRVSKGPDLVEVPDVVGLSKQEAEERLRAAGLQGPLSCSRWAAGSSSRAQAPGEQAKRGSEVRLLLNLF